MRPHLKYMHQQVAVFKKHVNFCRVKSARGYFLVVGIVILTAWLRHPLIASRQSLVAKARRAKEMGRPHVPNLVLQCPRSVWLKLAQLVVDHITLLVFVLTSACRVDKLDIVHQNAPTKEKRLHCHLAKGHLVPRALGCAVFDAPCYGATVEETEQDQDENDIEDLVAFSIKGLEGFAILDGGATKTVSGFMSIQTVTGSLLVHHD